MYKSPQIFENGEARAQYIQDSFLEMLVARYNNPSEELKREAFLEIKSFARAHNIPDGVFKISEKCWVNRVTDC